MRPAIVALVVVALIGLGGAAIAAKPGGKPAGPQEAVAFADVLENGTTDPNATSDGVSDSNISHAAGTGTYCFSGLSFTPNSAVVSGDNSFGNTDTIATVAIDNVNEGLGGCPAGSTLRVRTLDPNGVAGSSAGAYNPQLVDHRFVIWIRGEKK
jgi:hypothetical protein